MRRILVEHARRHNIKRGRDVRHVPLDEAVVVSTDSDVDLVALDDALNALGRFDVRKAQVVEMRFFGGLSVDETAVVLKVSPVTVRRDWTSAKIWRRRAPVCRRSQHSARCLVSAGRTDGLAGAPTGGALKEHCGGSERVCAVGGDYADTQTAS
nr:hypothetical protein Hi04_10k_c3826_00015 [uncultured bacterium]